MLVTLVLFLALPTALLNSFVDLRRSGCRALYGLANEDTCECRCIAACFDADEGTFSTSHNTLHPMACSAVFAGITLLDVVSVDLGGSSYETSESTHICGLCPCGTERCVNAFTAWERNNSDSGELNPYNCHFPGCYLNPCTNGEELLTNSFKLNSADWVTWGSDADNPVYGCGYDFSYLQLLEASGETAEENFLQNPFSNLRGVDQQCGSMLLYQREAQRRCPSN